MGLRIRYVLVFVVLIGTFATLAYRQIRGDLEIRYREAVEENLVDQAQMLASFLSTSVDSSELAQGISHLQAKRFEARIYEFVKIQSHLIVYVTNAEGKVLYHSKDPAQFGQSYANWRDVYLTLRGQYGARSTRTDSLDDNSSVLYVAAPIVQHGLLTGVVSVGKPVEDFNKFLNRARERAFWWLLAGALILVLIGIAAGRWVASPLRQIESDLKARAYIEEYVQTLTHELKSPISAILGATEILEEDPKPETRKHFLANIRTETQRMRDLVSTILQVASLERKKHLGNHSRFSTLDLVANLRESLQVPLHTKDIRIEWPSLATEIEGDKLLLTQGLHNLLGNAIEYSPKGSTIQFVLKETPDGMVAGHVRDYGPGIPDYAHKRLFEKFYSLPKPGTGKKGTGLGLVFAREAFRLHGGTVDLRNAPEGGALATFGWLRHPHYSSNAALR